MLSSYWGLEEALMMAQYCSSPGGLEGLDQGVDEVISKVVVVRRGMGLVRWSGGHCIAYGDILFRLPSRLHRCSCGMVLEVDFVNENVLLRSLP